MNTFEKLEFDVDGVLNDALKYINLLKDIVRQCSNKDEKIKSLEEDNKKLTHKLNSLLQILNFNNKITYASTSLDAYVLHLQKYLYELRNYEEFNPDELNEDEYNLNLNYTCKDIETVVKLMHSLGENK